MSSNVENYKLLPYAKGYLYPIGREEALHSSPGGDGILGQIDVWNNQLNSDHVVLPHKTAL